MGALRQAKYRIRIYEIIVSLKKKKINRRRTTRDKLRFSQQIRSLILRDPL